MQVCNCVNFKQQQLNEITDSFKFKRFSHREKISKVHKNIYIGSGSWIFNNASKVNICLTKFQKIINLASQEVEIGQLMTADVYSIDLHDIFSENIYKYFETLNEMFTNNRNENILVVCAAGISRSATIVLAYLLKQKFTLRNAIRFLLHKRPQIRPNNGFLLQLMAYENNLQKNQLEPLDLNCLEQLLSILPEYESFAHIERKANNKSLILHKNDEWGRLYYLGFRKS